MKIELLYVEGCPHRELARRRLDRSLRALGLPESVSEVLVPDPAAAVALRFLGSPSVRIDGVDIEPAAQEGGGFGLACRTYLEGGRRQGAPSQDSIERALREAGDE